MALVGREFKLFSIFMLWLFFSLLSSVHGSKQNENKWYGQFKYPFIKKASEFDSASPSFESKGRRNGEGGFDYIVVGGGTAGCPLAATLSYNFTVLVVERGGIPFSNANVSFLRNFHIGLADRSPLSASQSFVSTDGVINSRARVLGGGTAINAGFYTRASQSYVKKMGWNPKIVNESFAWVEKQIVHEPVVAPWQQAFKDSLLDIGVSPFNGFTYDHLYGTKVGGTIFDMFGRRHTAAELLASADPRRLTVLLYATVHRIIFDTTVKPLKAVGVVFKDEHGKQHEARINERPESEVIVTCGAIGTPQMLMLSGVGSRDELKRMNITLVLRNEFVGKGMVDNPMNSIFIPSHKPVEQSLIQTVGITKLGVYIEASSGFGQSMDSIHCHHGIMSAEIGQLSTVPPKQRTRERIDEYIKNKQDIPREGFQGGFILEKIAKPLSSGNLNLLTTNPEDNPSVTFNYFSHPADLRKCVAGVRAAVKVAQSKHFAGFSQFDERTAERLLNMSIKANVNLVPRHTNDSKSLEQFCRDTVITIWHYHGGAHVGKVVDKHYKVMGLAQLRVVDGSIFNDSPGTNPQATVMMMGRYMGVKILRERLGRAAGI